MEKLILTAMPTVVSQLVRKETDKGAPLTEAEVLAVRDSAHCVALPEAAAQEVARNRGYDDLDLPNVWASWLKFKETYPDGPAKE